MYKIARLLVLPVMLLAMGPVQAGMVFFGAYEGMNDGFNEDGSSMLDSMLGAPGPVAQLDRVDWDNTPAYAEDGITAIGPLTNPQISGELTVNGTVFKDEPDVTEAIAGTWEYTGNGQLDYLALKTDGWLIIYQITEGTVSGNWDLVQLAAETGCCTNGSGQVYALSHLSAYTVVPVPAAVWLLASGLLGLAVLGRGRRSL